MCKGAYCKTTNGYIPDLRSWVCTPTIYATYDILTCIVHTDVYNLDQITGLLLSPAGYLTPPVDFVTFFVTDRQTDKQTDGRTDRRIKGVLGLL